MDPTIRAGKTIDLESLDGDDLDETPPYLFPHDDEFSLACQRYGIDLSDLRPGVCGNEFSNLLLVGPGDMHTEIDLDPSPYVSDDESEPDASDVRTERRTLFTLIQEWYEKRVSDGDNTLPCSLNREGPEITTSRHGPSDVLHGGPSSQLRSRGTFGDGDCAAGPHDGSVSDRDGSPHEDGESEEAGDSDESDYLSDSPLSSRYDGVWKYDDRCKPLMHRACPICRPVGYCKFCSSLIRRPRRF